MSRVIINYFNSIKYGTIFYSLLYQLKKIGIEISPYYWEKEFDPICDEPKIKDEISDYSFILLNDKDILRLGENGHIINEKEKINRLNNGQICVGLIKGSEYTTFMWIELHQLSERMEFIKLEKNQAFLIGLKTIESYRGKNLAPYLRYKAYLFLMEKGINEFYSFSDFFNTPSIKFKKKLNSKHIKLRVYIEVFGKYRWNILVRRFD